MNKTAQTQNAALVSIVMLTYNNEEYVADALDGALSQTYRPLELVISDDASSDKTVEVIESVVNEYSGDIKITLNKNSENLGIGGQINRLMELSSGALIVAAAGDDISLPNRVQVLVECWKQNECGPMAIVSEAIAIDDQGKELGVFDYELPPGIHDPTTLARTWFSVLGAANAWTRSLFDVFGPFVPGLEVEDTPIVFRALLIGTVEKVDTALVKYRVGMGVSTRKLSEDIYERLFEIERRRNQRLITGFTQRRKDLQTINADEELVSIVNSQIIRHEFLLRLGKRENLRASYFADWVGAKLGVPQLIFHVLRYKSPQINWLWSFVMNLYIRAKGGRSQSPLRPF